MSVSVQSLSCLTSDDSPTPAMEVDGDEVASTVANDSIRATSEVLADGPEPEGTQCESEDTIRVASDDAAPKACMGYSYKKKVTAGVR